jgi:hypothetical protein
MYYTTLKPITTTKIAIFAPVAALMLITTSMIAVIIQVAHALTRYFNCTREAANKTRQLTIQDIHYCYDKAFPRSGH